MANSKDTGDGHMGVTSTGREPQGLGRVPPTPGKLGAIREDWAGSAQRRGLQRGLREVGGGAGRGDQRQTAPSDGGQAGGQRTRTWIRGSRPLTPSLAVRRSRP